MGLVRGNYTEAGLRKTPLGGKQKEVPVGLRKLVSLINQPQSPIPFSEVYLRLIPLAKEQVSAVLKDVFNLVWPEQQSAV